MRTRTSKISLKAVGLATRTHNASITMSIEADYESLDTKTLVDDFIIAVQTGSYKPGYSATSFPPTHFPALPIPTRSAVPVDVNGHSLNGRKRSFNQAQDNANGFDSHCEPSDRQFKQMRRGGRGRGGGSRGRGREGTDHSSMAENFRPGNENIQLPSEGYPQPAFDPNDPFSAMAAFQAMGLPMPQMPQMNPAKSNKRCRDYDTKGFCARGDACHFQHGTDHLVFPSQDEYDPKNALLTSTLTPVPISNGANGAPSPRGRGFGRGRGDRGGANSRRGNRADFSHAGPNNDRSITTIVVEQIPEEKFEEQAVRDFFSEFGSIAEVTMQPYKRLALVKYDDYFAARRAYDSPKVIFDNRFVKVYWYKPGALPTPPSTAKGTASSPTTATAEEQPFDKEEFEKKSQEAQKKLEEKKAQMKEMEAKRQALDRQKEELTQKQAEEKKRLLAKLAAKKGEGNADTDSPMTDAHANGAPPPEDDGKVSASTKALRAKLAELEAEAKSLGIDHSASEPYAPRGRGRGRGRGSYRGWEGFASGRGSYDPYRGSSPRGRGAFRGYGGGKYNLDLRTKKVAVSGVEWTGERDEALRQFLLVCFLFFFSFSYFCFAVMMFA